MTNYAKSTSHGYSEDVLKVICRFIILEIELFISKWNLY